MQKQRYCEKKNGCLLELKIHHIPCVTSNERSVLETDRICGVFFGPPEAGMGGGRAAEGRGVASAADLRHKIVPDSLQI